MRIGISYLGVDQHIALLEEESRAAAALADLLRHSCEQSRYDPDPGAEEAVFCRCTQAVETVADSIRWRSGFLAGLNERMQREAGRIHRMIGEMEEEL